MIRRCDCLSLSQGIAQDPACSPLAASCALGPWMRPAPGLQPPARRCLHARRPGIRKDVLRMRAKAGSPSILVHRLDVAQPAQPTTEEERHERSHP
jgi:hypothetical protein